MASIKNNDIIFITFPALPNPTIVNGTYNIDNIGVGPSTSQSNILSADPYKIIVNNKDSSYVIHDGDTIQLQRVNDQSGLVWGRFPTLVFPIVFLRKNDSFANWKINLVNKTSNILTYGSQLILIGKDNFSPYCDSSKNIVTSLPTNNVSSNANMSFLPGSIKKTISEDE